MDYTFTSDGLNLAARLSRPDRIGPRGHPCLVLCHGFPSLATGASGGARPYFQLADRLAREMKWFVVTVNLRGIGTSEGDFSLGGWLVDLGAAVDGAQDIEGVSGVWLAGFGTGAALAICAGASDLRVKGVAALAPPADFAEWASEPERLLALARERQAITSDGFPADFDQWVSELHLVKAVDGVADLAPRSLLVVHGDQDDAVPLFDSRVIADAHGSAELRVIDGAGHGLRYDPRAVAVLFGWLDRQSRLPVG